MALRRSFLEFSKNQDTDKSNMRDLLCPLAFKLFEKI